MHFPSIKDSLQDILGTFRVKFVFSLLFLRFETQRKQQYKQLYILILQKTATYYVLVIKTQNYSRFSNTITHTYVNTINDHYFKERHYMNQNSEFLVI